MIANYYTLRHLASDLNWRLAGAIVDEVFCQTKNELMICVGSRGESLTLLVSCEPSMNYLFLRGEVSRARRNSIDLFKELLGKSIERVSIQPADRELVLCCSDGTRAVIQLFASRANILLLDTSDRILEAFLHPKEYRGKMYEPRARAVAVAPMSLDELNTSLQAIGSILLPAALKRLFPLFGTILIRELCHRAGLSENQLVAELGDGDRKRLFGEILALLGQLEGPPSPRLYYQEQSAALFSIVPLAHVKATREEMFDSLHDAIRMFLGKSRRQRVFMQERTKLVHFLERNAEHAERALQKITKESEVLERAAQYELSAKLVMANLHRIDPRRREVELENVFSSEREMVAIPLEPALSAAENAERYFEKAKKARVGVEEKTKHREETEEQWELLRDLLRRAPSLQTLEQLADFLAVNAESLAQVGYRSESGGVGQPREQAPFRTFVVAGGFTVWVGKSSENNDLLTLKYAKPGDLWFHARGSSGSHVVLRTGTGKGQPSRRAIDEAAGIAAYYSKMKGARNVPVAMTQRKFVRKPKGAPAGSVTIEREKLLFVEPRLPDISARG